MIVGGSATRLLAGHSWLLFYTCSLPPLIPTGWSDLFSHSLSVNHPLAAAKVSQLLPPELAARITVIQSKDGKKWQRERACGWGRAQSQLLAARGLISPVTCDTLMLLGATNLGSPVAHWGLRSIAFTSRSFLVQLRGRPWKNTQDSWKYRQKSHVCRSRAPFPWKQKLLCTILHYFPRGKLWKVCSVEKKPSSETLWG